MNHKTLTSAALALILAGCASQEKETFWTVRDGHFCKGDSAPVYYIGTNMWYGPLLASGTAAADLPRLTRELDSLKSIGVTNLRVLVGADGECGVKSKVEPTLQIKPGVYDEEVFAGLDRFLAELGRRDMSAVLFINNAWEWSGGFGQYLEWAGEGKALSTVDALWSDYCEHTSKFITCDAAKEMFARHLTNVVSRVNTVTGKNYRDDPAIFSWQICNEPRFFLNGDPALKQAFADWLCESAALIKSIDPNHMVSTGSEGSFGCEGDMELFTKIHACPDIDYLTIHIWPLNWSWVHRDSLAEDLPEAIRKTDEYIAAHIEAAKLLGKPLVLEEFGFPRDGFRFDKSSPTTLRDKFYGNVFDTLTASKQRGDVFAGVNFWTWGGEARQRDVYWQRGDDYCGDPAQEQQGLNSVYLGDSSTISLLRDACRRLK